MARFHWRLAGYLLSLGILLGAPICSAHEDFDLALSQLTLNQNCHPVITVKNTGTRQLPKTFYLAQNPAFIEFSKPATAHAAAVNFYSKPINALDIHRALKQPGGTLHIEVPKIVSNNPAPLKAQLNVQGEFWDYGQANDRLEISGDCQVGKGATPGDALAQKPADLSMAALSSKGGCQVGVQLRNLNQGLVQASAYSGDPDSALVISVYERTLQKRLPSVLLRDLDPTQTLLTGTANLVLPLPQGDYTVSLWQAQGDENFANNHRDVRVNECPQ